MRMLVLIICCWPMLATAQLKVAAMFSNNMVLQRDAPIKIWGTAHPGQTVKVRFGSFTNSNTVQNDSTWTVSLPAQKSNHLPQGLTISCGKEIVELKNILVGDVWVCIGQSNMEWPMVKEQHWKQEKQHTNQSLIRLFNPTPVGRNVFGTPYSDSLVRRLTPEKFYEWNGWENCDSISVQQMSAVAYYFAKKVNTETGVPVGIINLSIGGAPLETFISEEALWQDKTFSKKLNGNWLTNDALPIWVRERGMQNVGHLSALPGDAFGPNHAYKPGFAFAAGVQPLVKMAVKGMLCYQGESNAQEMERVNEYAALSALMLKDYRKKWSMPNLPFYFVQLSSIDTVKYKGQLWPQFRNEQRKMLQLIPHSGMAVCSDIGAKDDVHPTNKKNVGERLAFWALHKTYQQNIIPSGPLPVKAVYKAGKLIVTFHYSKHGLATSDGKTVRGFSTDGTTEAPATIAGNTIVIAASKKPKYVYYEWQPWSNGNLVNSQYLAASTFKIQVQK